MSEEKGERLHQDIKQWKQGYQGRWNCSMMVDYCWSLKRDCYMSQKEKPEKSNLCLLPKK